MVVPAQAQQTELTADGAGFGPGPRDYWRDDFGDAARQSASPPGAAEQARRACPACGEKIVATAAKCRFCGTLFDPRLRGAAYRRLITGRGSPADRARRIRSAFTTMWSSMILGPVLVAAAVAFAAGANDPGVLVAALGIALVDVLVGGIAYLVLIYRLWSVVQDGRAQTTPGNAVGFLFIPCFNIYWQFVAYWGLSKELNRIRREYGVAAPAANESLALMACILHCCMWVPYFGALLSLPLFIVWTIELKGMCKTAIAIIQAPALQESAGEMNTPNLARGPSYAY
jgi:hypothetical protein